VVKIKRDLIHKAKVRKEYAKVRSREEEAGTLQPHISTTQLLLDNDGDESNGTTAGLAQNTPPVNTMHQDRIDAINNKDDNDNDGQNSNEADNNHNDSREQRQQQRKSRQPKTSRYVKESEAGAQVREAREAHARMIVEKKEAAKRREMENKRRNHSVGFAKGARTKTGQTKLGRQSKGLLEQVMKMVGDK